MVAGLSHPLAFGRGGLLGLEDGGSEGEDQEQQRSGARHGTRDYTSAGCGALFVKEPFKPFRPRKDEVVSGSHTSLRAAEAPEVFGYGFAVLFGNRRVDFGADLPAAFGLYLTPHLQLELLEHGEHAAVLLRQ